MDPLKKAQSHMIRNRQRNKLQEQSTMYINKQILTAIALNIMPMVGFAFFCPTNFNQIDFGMTVDQVTQICGKPDSNKESKKENENVPQEWTYYIPQSVGMNNYQQAQGTLKTSVSFDDKGKAINISVNGIGVGATTICGSSVQLGATQDTIKSACGKPAVVNKQPQTPEEAAKQETKVNEFSYSKATTPVVLIFENGKLTDKK
jgi:hypothetical protein